MSKKTCPLIKDECMEHRCEFYTHLLGRNPQTGLDEDKWGCAISWIPVLLIENASTVRQAAASTDKVASEVRKHHATFLSVLNEESKLRLLDADPKLQVENKNGSTGA